jgi:ERCC4-type nuclease
MLIRVDVREDALYSLFQMNLNLVSCDSIKSTHDKATHSLRSETLPVGDVVLSSADGETDYIVFERKSLQDLASSIRDGRYKEQSLRLQHIPNLHNHNVVYIVEGDFARYNDRFSRIGKGALHSAMCSLNYYKGFSVVRTMSIMETYEIIHSYANKLAASPAPYGHYYKVPSPIEAVEAEAATAITTATATATAEDTASSYCSVLKVKQIKCENITPQNIGEIMLCNIPGVSNKTASAIVKKYPTLRTLIEALKESSDCLDDIRLETQRKLSKQCIQNIYNFLMM